MSFCTALLLAGGDNTADQVLLARALSKTVQRLLNRKKEMDDAKNGFRASAALRDGYYRRFGDLKMR